MTDDGAGPGETEAKLLATLREATDRPDLDFAEPPSPLTGGFYADLWRFRLADPPEGLDGDLVGRILPNPALGAWESVFQGYVSEQGFATPTVRLSVGEHSPLGRYLLVMDLVDGRPPMDGLSIGTVALQLPNLLRRLPDQLASVAAALHALDPEPLAAKLEQLDEPLPITTADFVRQQIDLAAALGEADLVATGDMLLDTEPEIDVRVVSHGDLHPFNLLITPSGPVLIDWSVTRIAHPGFTLAFTDLMLNNPPIRVPSGVEPGLRRLSRGIATRFHARYRELAPARVHVSEDQLDWHRQVHALRILVELAGWDALGTRPASGHPWLILEAPARGELGLDPLPG